MVSLIYRPISYILTDPQKCLLSLRPVITQGSICSSEIFTGPTPTRSASNHPPSHPPSVKSSESLPLAAKEQKCSSRQTSPEVCSTQSVTISVMSRESLLCHEDSRLTLRYMNAAKYGLDRVYFGGCFIRGEISSIMP